MTIPTYLHTISKSHIACCLIPSIYKTKNLTRLSSVCGQSRDSTETNKGTSGSVPGARIHNLQPIQSAFPSPSPPHLECSPFCISISTMCCLGEDQHVLWKPHLPLNSLREEPPSYRRMLSSSTGSMHVPMPFSTDPHRSPQTL